MSGCQTCDYCEVTCNSCQECNQCEKCNEQCDGGGCETIQTFCALDKQEVGPFRFYGNTEKDPIGVIKKDDLFFSKSTWNKIFRYINAAYNKGNHDLENNARSGVGVQGHGDAAEELDSDFPSSDPNDFMTADMFNKVSEALGGLGSSGPSFRATANVDIVYGHYFNTLEKYADEMLYLTTQCNDCNAACNIQCNTCLFCDKNDNCKVCDDGCQAHDRRDCCSRACEVYAQNPVVGN